MGENDDEIDEADVDVSGDDEDEDDEEEAIDDGELLASFLVLIPCLLLVHFCLEL